MMGDGGVNDPLASDYEIEGTIDADGDSENDDDDTASVTSASSVSSTASQRAAKEAFFAPAPHRSKRRKESFICFSQSLPPAYTRPYCHVFKHSNTHPGSNNPSCSRRPRYFRSCYDGLWKDPRFFDTNAGASIVSRTYKWEHGRGGEIHVLVLVLVPTRELAVQCADMGNSLARFTDITSGVIVSMLRIWVL